MTDLTTDQKIDALYQKFVGGGADVGAPASPGILVWWNPTPAQYAAFAARFGVPVAAISPWVQGPTGMMSGMAFPILPAVSARAAVLEYAGFGYGPNGKQQLFTEPGFTPRRHLCDLLALPTTDTPAKADAILTGAGAPGVEPDAVRLALMTGLIEVNPFISPTFHGAATVDDVIATLTYVPVAGGGGPGIG